MCLTGKTIGTVHTVLLDTFLSAVKDTNPKLAGYRCDTLSRKTPRIMSKALRAETRFVDKEGDVGLISFFCEACLTTKLINLRRKHALLTKKGALG